MGHSRSGGRRRAGAALLAALAFLAAGGAQGAGCTVSSSGLAFGAYQPLSFAGKLTSSAVTTDASVNVACAGLATGGGYTIALGPSAGGGDGISMRRMSNPAGGDAMQFNVYREPTFSTIWGDGVIAGSVLSGTVPPGDSNRSHTVYGRIGANQSTLKAGTFGVVLTMTLTFSP